MADRRTYTLEFKREAVRLVTERKLSVPEAARQLVVDALEMALERQLPGAGLVTHSDRGVQYASEHYRELLTRHGIACSMMRGNSKAPRSNRR